MHYSHNNSLIHRSLTGFGLNKVDEFTAWDYSHASALGEFSIQILVRLFVETRYGERVRHRLWGTCNNRTMVPHKEIQWHNGTPQEKF